MKAFDNFFTSTYGQFIEIANRPAGEPSYVSMSKTEPGKISSEYWYGEDGHGKFVVRGSDHWSDVSKVPSKKKMILGRQLPMIATCFWTLKIRKREAKVVRYGKIYLSKFIDVNDMWKLERGKKINANEVKSVFENCGNGRVNITMNDGRTISRIYNCSDLAKAVRLRKESNVAFIKQIVKLYNQVYR